MAARPEQTPARTGAPKRRSPLRRVAGALLPKPSPPIDTGTCSICAYDLEGLPPWWVRDARCPECGSNIALARLGSDLAAEDPRALRSLTLGLDALSFSIAVTVVVPILALLSMLAINSVIDLVTGSGNGWAPIEIIGAILLTGAPIIGAALWCIAWAMLAPATRKAGISPESRAVRAVMLAALAASVAAVIAALLCSTLGPAWTRDLALTLAAACFFVTAGAGLVLLRALAKRTTDQHIRRSITQMLALTPLLVVGTLWLGYAEIAGIPDQGTAGGIVMLLVLIWVLSILSSASRLARTVRAARLVQHDRPHADPADSSQPVGTAEPRPTGTLPQDAG